jgi:glycosyltransferase involved in cell wall biosynthesis
MRILYLNPSGALGGAERVLLSVMAAVRRADPSAELHLLTCADGPLLDRARRAGARADVLPLPPVLAAVGDSRLHGRGLAARAWRAFSDGVRGLPAAVRYARRLGRAVRELAPDVVHSNGIKTHLLAGLARPGGVPVVWHLHDFCGSRPLAARLLGRTGRTIAAAVAVSEAVAADARRLMPGVAVRVIANAVDVAAFAPGPGDEARLDALAGLPPAADVVRVGLVATYARWKGQDVFLEAAARLRVAGAGRRLRFYVVGGPIYQSAGSQFSEPELRALAGRHGLGEAVGFVPFQDDPAPVYRALDVMVHASTRPEPFGLTIAEAMACGRAVIATQAGGAAELFRHGQDAWGVPPGDAAALASAVERLAADPDQRRRLGESARRSAVERFDDGRLAADYAALYARLSERRHLEHLRNRGSDLARSPAAG